MKIIFKLAEINREVTIKNPDTGIDDNKPLYEIASSHLARRTFINTIYQKVKDPSRVCPMTGHVPNSISLNRYRDVEDKNLLVDTIKYLSSEPKP